MPKTSFEVHPWSFGYFFDFVYHQHLHNDVTFVYHIQVEWRGVFHHVLVLHNFIESVKIRIPFLVNTQKNDIMYFFYYNHDRNGDITT